MPIPIVTIVAPLVASPAGAQALVASCDQAFSVGDCVLSTGEPEPDTLVASVAWKTKTTAEITVVVPPDAAGGATSRLAQEIQFQVQDAEIERYRSIGFSIGSLSSWPFRQDDEPPPALLVPPDESEHETDVESEPESEPTSQPLSPTTRVSRGTPHEPSGSPLAGGFTLGGLVGTAYAKYARFGGTAGAWLGRADSWIGGAWIGYSGRPTVSPDVDADGLAERIDVRHFAAAGYFGPAYALGYFDFAFCGLVMPYRVDATNVVAGDRGSQWVWTGGLVAKLSASRGQVRPFLDLVGTFGREVELRFDEGSAGSDGPVRLEAQLGLALVFGGK